MSRASPDRCEASWKERQPRSVRVSSAGNAVPKPSADRTLVMLRSSSRSRPSVSRGAMSDTARQRCRLSRVSSVRRPIGVRSSMPAQPFRSRSVRPVSSPTSVRSVISLQRSTCRARSVVRWRRPVSAVIRRRRSEVRFSRAKAGTSRAAQKPSGSAALGHSRNNISEEYSAARSNWAARASAVPSSGIRTSSPMALRILTGLPVASSSRSSPSWLSEVMARNRRAWV